MSGDVTGAVDPSACGGTLKMRPVPIRLFQSRGRDWKWRTLRCGSCREDGTEGWDCSLRERLRQLRPRSAGDREARDNTVAFRQFVAPLKRGATCRSRSRSEPVHPSVPSSRQVPPLWLPECPPLLIAPVCFSGLVKIRPERDNHRLATGAGAPHCRRTVSDSWQ